MAWDFQRRLARQLSNPDIEASFQSDLYKNINPKTAKAIIAATHHPNRDMHNISTLVNYLPVRILRRNKIDNDIMTPEDTWRGCECLLSSPVHLFYTRHTEHFLTVWVIHMGSSLLSMWEVMPILCVVENIGSQTFHSKPWHPHFFIKNVSGRGLPFSK